MKSTKFNFQSIFAMIVFSFLLCCTGNPPCTDIGQSAFSEGSQPSTCPPEDQTSEDEIIVKFNKHASLQQKCKTIENLLDTATTAIPCACDDDFFIVTYPSNPEIDQEARVKSARSDVAHEENGEPVADVFLNININLIAPDGLLNYSKIKESQLKHPILYPAVKDIVVAVIDGGIDNSTDSNLRDKFWVNGGEAVQPLDKMDNDDNCFVDDINGHDFTEKINGEASKINRHGTMVSKILTEPLTDGTKIYLMDLRIFDKNGKSNLYDGLCAIKYAILNRVDLINISWGYYLPDLNSLSTSLDSINQESNSLFLEILEEAQVADIPVVASAGNRGLDTDKCPHYPSSFSHPKFSTSNNLKNVISVAATDYCCDQMPQYSNFGIKSVQIAARGIHSIDDEVIEGTSYAAPEITRVLAKMIANRNLPSSRIDLKKKLLNNITNKSFTIQEQGIPNWSVYHCQ